MMHVWRLSDVSDVCHVHRA